MLSCPPCTSASSQRPLESLSRRAIDVHPRDSISFARHDFASTNQPALQENLNLSTVANNRTTRATRDLRCMIPPHLRVQVTATRPQVSPLPAIIIRTYHTPCWQSSRTAFQPDSQLTASADKTSSMSTYRHRHDSGRQMHKHRRNMYPTQGCGRNRKTSAANTIYCPYPIPLSRKYSRLWRMADILGRTILCAALYNGVVRQLMGSSRNVRKVGGVRAALAGWVGWKARR